MEWRREKGGDLNVLYLGEDETDILLAWKDLMPDVETEEDILALARRLQSVAPHIRWRVRRRVGSPGGFVTLTVPVEQLDEAEFILDLWEKGKSLEGYCTEWMYPEVYAVVDGQAVLKQEIATFVGLAGEFMKLVLEGPRYDLPELIFRLLRLLSQLYVAALDLPFLPQDAARKRNGLAERVKEQVGSFSKEQLPESWPEFGGLDKYCGFEGPYGSGDDLEGAFVLEERSLSRDLFELFNVLWSGMVFFEKKDLEGILNAVNYWNDAFHWTGRWGYRLLQVLSALQQAVDIEKEVGLAERGSAGIARVMQRMKSPPGLAGGVA